jgi:hypothetical protein
MSARYILHGPAEQRAYFQSPVQALRARDDLRSTRHPARVYDLEGREQPEVGWADLCRCAWSEAACPFKGRADGCAATTPIDRDEP